MSAQESDIINIEDCPNYNNFLEDEEQMDSIWNYVTEIRPGGRMIFQPEAITSVADYQHFLTFLNLDSNATFEFVTEHPNRHQPEKSFLRYQQYIDGIPIEGGGVVVSGIFAPGTGPDGPGGPCSRVMMMVPHVANDVNVDLNPTLDKNQAFIGYDTLPSFSPDSLTLIDADLVITSNMNNDCNYHLAWKFIYLNENNSEKFAYVNAHNGDVLLRGSCHDANLPARTDHYGWRTLVNLQENGTTFLISPDERITTYHFNRDRCDYDIGHYQEQFIPFTTDPFSWGSTTIRGAYQSFFVAQSVLPLLDDIDVEFEKVWLMVGCIEPVSLNHKNSRLAKSYTMYGIDIDDRSTATFNNVCHELGHGYIAEYISSDRLKGGSLHEGIADMFGIFCHWGYFNNLNWVYGHESNTGNLVQDYPRDLSNPIYDCFSVAKNISGISEHARGAPLGHLFYLLVEGGANYNAPLLPVDIALQIILDGLPELNSDNSDYPQLRDATINQVIENFGYCSDEFMALVKAWEEICLHTDFTIETTRGKTIKVTDCEYFVNGAAEVCWDSDNAQICLNIPGSIDHGINTAHNTWTIIGPGSTQFESAGGMTGNQQQGGTCLNLTSIPELEYYPRWVNIRLNFTTHEGSKTWNHKLLIYDCTGTKPTCESYHGLKVIKEDEDTQEENQDEAVLIEENYSTMEVYDILGRLHYQGNVMDLSAINIPDNQVLVIRYLDEGGIVIKTDKMMIVK